MTDQDLGTLMMVFALGVVPLTLIMIVFTSGFFVLRYLYKAFRKQLKEDMHD